MEKELFTTVASKLPIPKITFTNDRTRRDMVFDPLSDITAFELAKILELFLVFSFSGQDNSYGVDTYIRAHNLERHFIAQ